MTHDPLCPHAAPSWTADECSQCRLLTAVRADERDAIVARLDAINVDEIRGYGWPYDGVPLGLVLKVARGES